MVVYQTIAALVNQIPVDTWDVLREIKERRPAIMLSELINCRTQASQPSERPEPESPRQRIVGNAQSRNEELGPLRTVAPDGGSAQRAT
jgi:hypothetical protein